MAAAAALTCAPFLVSCRRVFLPSISRRHRHSHSSSTTIPNSNVPKFTPLLLLLSRHAPPISILGNTTDDATTSRTSRKPMQFLCYCTETEAPNDNNNNNENTASTTSTLDKGKGEDGEDKSIKEAANTLDLRVGKIVKAWRHEEADSLYVEEVDVGEPEPRTICSGLVNYIPLHLLQDRNVIVLANLKPRNMRGVKSLGMLMAASDATHENIELLTPPEGAVPGDRVWFGSVNEKENLPDVASPNQVQKKKIWELVQPHLRTDETCVATLGTNHQMRTSAGLIISQSLKNANIS